MHETEHSEFTYQLPPITLTVVLLAITLLGLGVRLNGLTAYGLWFDEAYHIELIRLPTVWSMLDAVLSNPPSDPLYVLVLRLWTSIWGTSVESIRSLSVILGTATIPATYLLGRYMSGTAAGVGAALFFAISPYALELGQEAALYTLAAALTTSALAAGWRWLRTDKGLVYYTVFGVFAIYSHYVAAVILLLFAAMILVFELRANVKAKLWLGVNGLILVSWLSWLIALIVHWADSNLPRASIQHRVTPEEVLGGLVQYTSGTASLLQGPRVLQVAGLALGLVLLLLSWWVARGSGKKAIMTMSALLGLIFLVPALVSTLTGMWLFVTHFMLFLLPTLFVCLCGFLANTRFKLSPLRNLGLIAVAGWIGVQTWGIVLYNRNPPHGADGLRELAMVIKGDGTAGQPVFVTPPALMPVLAQYYRGELNGLPEDFDLRRVYIPFVALDWYSRSIDIVDAKVKGHDSFWLVYRPELDDEGRLLSQLRSAYKVKLEEHYLFSDLYLFAAKP